MADVPAVAVGDKPLTVESYAAIFEANDGVATPTMVAEMLRVSRQRVYQLCQANTLRTVKVAGRCMVALREVRQRQAEKAKKPLTKA